MQAAGAALANGAPNSRQTAIKVVILLTDGIRTTGPDPVPLARQLARDGGLIFTITFSNEADRNLMRRVAERGNGSTFNATDAASLQTAFTEIAKALPTLITE